MFHWLQTEEAVKLFVDPPDLPKESFDVQIGDSSVLVGIRGNEERFLGWK